MTRQARLVYTIPTGDEELVLAQVSETTIGRHPESTICVSQPSVSRRHAKLWYEAGGYYFQDLDSSNGSYINNQRITKASLTDGDELRCGDFKLRYIEVDGTVEAPTPGEGPRVVGALQLQDGPARPAGRVGRVPSRNDPHAALDEPPNLPVTLQ